MTQLILAISLWVVYLLLIQKDSVIHIHGLAVYVKEGLFFTHAISLEKSADYYLYFQLALLHSVSYFRFLHQSPYSCLRTVFDAVSSNISQVILINAPGIGFVFGDCNLHHKNWLTYFGGTARSGELSQMTLLR